MRVIAAGLLVMSGCAILEHYDPKPGRADLVLSELWVQGQPTTVDASWERLCVGGEGFCTKSSVTILEVACNGCVLPRDPIGRWGTDRVSFDAIATTDGAIAVSAKLRFGPTGDTTRVMATAMGDHEVALEATCGLVETAVLDHDAPYGRPRWEQFRACDTPRLASDTVAIFPMIRTFRGNTGFPFCDGNPCTSNDGLPLRRLSSISIAPAPTIWRTTAEGRTFAVVPVLPAGQTVELSVRLLPSGSATTSVVVPGVS